MYEYTFLHVMLLFKSSCVQFSLPTVKFALRTRLLNMINSLEEISDKNLWVLSLQRKVSCDINTSSTSLEKTYRWEMSKSFHGLMLATRNLIASGLGHCRCITPVCRSERVFDLPVI